MRDTAMHESIVGSILGGAIGDGWGRPHEGAVPPVTAPIPAELVVTDDTQLTIATCESIIDRGGVDPGHIAGRFLRWFREGRIHGMGASTLKAMRDLDAGAHWALAGAKGERAAGNGAAMRVAPLAFMLDPTDGTDRVLLRDVCRITHHHDEAYAGALAVAMAIRLAARDESVTATMLTDVAALLPDSQVRDRLDRFAAFGGDVSPAQVADCWGSSGYVVESVPIAIFAARDCRRRPFSEIVQRAVEAGGDADTIASIAGQIAGAAVGLAGLPTDLLARLRDQDDLTAVASAFSQVATGG
jgi:ADP-ribosylglycohydrolase